MQKKRVVNLSFFPVLAFIFIIGWVLYVTGKLEPRQVSSKNVKAAKKEHDLEIGLIAELTEEKLTVKEQF